MRVRRFSAVTVLCLALAACADDPGEPSALPTLDPSEAATASPSPEPTPTGIDAATPEGAADFARYFYAQVREGFRTQSPELVERISLDSCQTCSNYVRSITTVREQDLTVEGGDFDIYLAVAPGQDDPSTSRVDVGWNFQAVTYRSAAGEVVEQGQAVTGVEEQMDLVRQGSQWKVSKITRVRQQ